MKIILIHSNNTSLGQYPEFFTDQLIFDGSLNDLDDVDVYLNRFIGQNCDLIKSSHALFIKYSLSANYSDLLGLRLGHYIRLSPELSRGRALPIIFIGDETPIQILKLSYLGNILSTPGVYFATEQLSSLPPIIQRIKDGTLPGLVNFQDYHERIIIHPPANYLTHHSIANEWGLIRFFNMLEEDESNLQYVKLKEKVQALNYFKSLHFRYNESAIDRQRFSQKKGHAIDPRIRDIEGCRIGFIDDEFIKGWNEFFEYVLLLSKATFVPFTRFEKGSDREKLIVDIKQWINDQQARNELCDIYVIDLRLHDRDFYDRDNPATGIIIAEYIKKHY